MPFGLKIPQWLTLPAWLQGGPAVPGRSVSWLEPRIPSVAFDLDPGSMAMVRIGRRGKESYLASYNVEEIPPELLEVEFLKAKLAQPERFREIVAHAVARDGVRVETASLLLPDNYARVAILPFEEMPRRRSDALELIRWKTRKSVPFKVEEAAVDYLVLPGGEGAMQVLAVLTPRSIIEEFEHAFAAAGVHAGLIDLSTFSLVNLYRSVFEAEMNAAAEYLVANVAGGFMTFVIFRGARITFYRCKPFATGTGDDGGEGARRLLRRELQTSLLYYREKLGGHVLARAYLRVVDLEPAEVGRIFSEEPEIADVAFIDPRRVLAINGRFTGDHGERLLQRLAPALGAAVGRRAA